MSTPDGLEPITPRPVELQIEGATIRITGKGRTPIVGRVLEVHGPYQPDPDAPWPDEGGWSVIYEQIEPTHLAGRPLFLNQVKIANGVIVASGGIDRIEVLGGHAQLRLF